MIHAAIGWCYELGLHQVPTEMQALVGDTGDASGLFKRRTV